MKTFKHIPSPPLPELETIENEKGRFYISPNGIHLPSVTTVLGAFKQDGLQKWRDRIGDEAADRIMYRAATRGTAYHNMVEKYMLNEHSVMFDGVMPDMKQMFMDAKKELDRIDNIRYSEASLYSEKYGIAGRCDLVADFDGTLSIIDHKTSRKTKKKEWITGYFEQTAAYAIMLYRRTGLRAKQGVVIIADDDHNVDVHVVPVVDYAGSLLEKIKAYRERLNVL